MLFGRARDVAGTNDGLPIAALFASVGVKGVMWLLSAVILHAHKRPAENASRPSLLPDRLSSPALLLSTSRTREDSYKHLPFGAACPRGFRAQALLLGLL